MCSIASERRRTDGEALAVKQQFARGNVRPRGHEANGEIQLVALEIGSVVARHDPHIDSRVSAIEPRQPWCKPERRQATGRRDCERFPEAGKAIDDGI